MRSSLLRRWRRWIGPAGGVWTWLPVVMLCAGVGGAVGAGSADVQCVRSDGGDDFLVDFVGVGGGGVGRYRSPTIGFRGGGVGCAVESGAGGCGG